MKKKVVSKLMVALLFLTTALTPLSALAADEAVGGVKDAEVTEKAVFSIDAGRKYFSEEQLKEIIHNAYLNGYTDVQLILANDANRFFLDDMTVTTDTTTYESEDVKDALTVGNNIYYEDPNGNALTEEEMDRVLDFAAERGIGIIPLINSPGHMDSILDAMVELGIDEPHYETSRRTVDLENKEALAFTKELVNMYAAYFSKQSEIFNIGADEYANDVSTAGWAGIQQSGLYADFVDYINDLSAIVKSHDMRPIAYNDGIYYNEDDSFGEFDTDIIVAYWTAGWWGFDVAKPEIFLDKGHELISSNDGWYWVLGNYTADDGIYALDGFYDRIENIPFSAIPGRDDVPLPALGSIHSVWADDPSKDHDMPAIEGLMEKYGEVHSDHMNKPTIEDPAEAAALVKRMIYNLPKASELTLADKEIVAEVRAAYEALSEEAKALVDTIGNLEKREARLAELELYGLKDVAQALVDAGEFSNDQAGRIVVTHVTALGHYLDQGQTDKVIKHLEGLFNLLDNQLANNLISEEAYETLYGHAEEILAVLK